VHANNKSWESTAGAAATAELLKLLISNRTNRIIRMHKYTNTNTWNTSFTFSRKLPTFHTSWKYIQSRQHPDNGHNCENVHVMLRCYTVVCVTDLL